MKPENPNPELIDTENRLGAARGGGEGEMGKEDQKKKKAFPVDMTPFCSCPFISEV